MYLKLSAIALAVTFGMYAHAEPPREEMAHAYYLLKEAKSDYSGHKAAAMKHIEGAAHDLGVEFKGGASEPERQWKSDKQLEEARRLLMDARDKMEQHDRDRVADRLQKAINQLDKALNTR